jgi:RNA polymerase sigma-70 factor (ECF subfamily)
MSMNEKILISRVLDGDQDAFAPLVDRYHVGVILYCERFVRDRAAAEDLAQDIFMTAYQQLKKFDSSRGVFSTWLYQLARTRCLDDCRRKKIHIDIDALPDLAALTEPLSLAEKAEIRTAVEELEPPIYRHVIEAYYWHGKSYDDIAREYELPLNTVRTNLRRAKLQLKGVLA